ncbi:MAG: hypothetical protein JWO34_983 [Arthrobacter sp.]|nr:hypothetical protein [Arthrobacter sp.]
MKKSIRLLGTTLLVAGMGIGGTALTAGAASADTGTQAASLQVTGQSWSDGDNCWSSDGNWNKDGRDRNGDRCGDEGNHNGDHKGDRNGDHKDDRNSDHNGDGHRSHCD